MNWFCNNLTKNLLYIMEALLIPRNFVSCMNAHMLKFALRQNCSITKRNIFSITKELFIIQITIPKTAVLPKITHEELRRGGGAHLLREKNYTSPLSFLNFVFESLIPVLRAFIKKNPIVLVHCKLYSGTSPPSIIHTNHHPQIKGPTPT